jgi:hypothetical protein
MSRLAANPAASPSLSLRTADAATASVISRDSGAELPSFWIGLGRSSASAIAPDFCRLSTDENFGPVCVCRYVSRLLLGHCFGAFAAPGGTAPLCFGFAALWVMVPP